MADIVWGSKEHLSIFLSHLGCHRGRDGKESYSQCIITGHEMWLLIAKQGLSLVIPSSIFVCEQKYLIFLPSGSLFCCWFHRLHLKCWSPHLMYRRMGSVLALGELCVSWGGTRHSAEPLPS